MNVYSDEYSYVDFVILIVHHDYLNRKIQRKHTIVLVWTSLLNVIEAEITDVRK